MTQNFTAQTSTAQVFTPPASPPPTSNPPTSNPSAANLSRNQELVLQALGTAQESLSAQTLHAELRSAQHRVGLATIYRALETLKLRGLVQSRSTVNGEALYSLTQEDRHYLTCLQCGTSEPLEVCPVHDLELHLKASKSFKIYYHTLEFFGLCQRCQSQNP